jgi:hypothetical protein
MNIRRTQHIKAWIKEKTGMADNTFDQIDWQSHTMAVSTSQLPHLFVVNLLHQLIPVGTVIHRYDPVKYMSLCPTCNAQEETYDHLFQCSNPSCSGWKSGRCTALLMYTKETHSHTIMQHIPITGIHHWIHHLSFPTHRFSHHWHELIPSQSNIGWKQLLLGGFSNKWTAFHCQNLQQNHLTLNDFNHGEIWLSKMITIIWTHCHQLWESRNKDKHGHD